MVFNSFSFIIIYPLIFFLYYLIPQRYQVARNLFLLIVSYLLYLSWKPTYAFILLAITCITYFTALAVNRFRNQAKLLITFGVIMALFPLLLFKYFNFINDSVLTLLTFIGSNWHVAGLNWVIPIGISFFTFQGLGYMWDVYYKKIEPEKDFFTYALFLSFFPSILSGPINKASLVIPR